MQILLVFCVFDRVAWEKQKTTEDIKFGCKYSYEFGIALLLRQCVAKSVAL